MLLLAVFPLPAGSQESDDSGFARGKVAHSSAIRVFGRPQMWKLRSQPSNAMKLSYSRNLRQTGI